MIKEKADVIVVSQIPEEALEREWKEHNIDSYVDFIAGQEMGTKTEHISLTAGNKYSPNKMLIAGSRRCTGRHEGSKGKQCTFLPYNFGKRRRVVGIIIRKGSG